MSKKTPNSSRVPVSMRSSSSSSSSSSGFTSLLKISAFVVWFLRIVTREASDSGVAAVSLAPIVWNSSNPMFKSSKNDHVIEVNPYDDLDFVCPHLSTLSEEEKDEEKDNDEEEVEDGTDAEQNAYYVIYKVSKPEYDDCTVFSGHGAVTMLNCSSPGQRKRFTILFEPYPSIPNVPEYHPGSSYYFVSTSSGAKSGLGNLYKGACSQHNMKLTIRICCSQNTRQTVVQTSAILPDHSSSNHQRKHFAVHRHNHSHSAETVNRRRSRIHQNAAEEHEREPSTEFRRNRTWSKYLNSLNGAKRESLVDLNRGTDTNTRFYSTSAVLSFSTLFQLFFSTFDLGHMLF